MITNVEFYPWHPVGLFTESSLATKKYPIFIRLLARVLPRCLQRRGNQNYNDIVK